MSRKNTYYFSLKSKCNDFPVRWKNSTICATTLLWFFFKKIWDSTQNWHCIINRELQRMRKNINWNNKKLLKIKKGYECSLESQICARKSPNNRDLADPKKKRREKFGGNASASTSKSQKVPKKPGAPSWRQLKSLEKNVYYRLES